MLKFMMFSCVKTKKIDKFYFEMKIYKKITRMALANFSLHFLL